MASPRKRKQKNELGDVAPEITAPRAELTVLPKNIETPAGASTTLKLSVRTLRRLVQSGTIPPSAYVRINAGRGRHILRFDMDKVWSALSPPTKKIS